MLLVSAFAANARAGGASAPEPLWTDVAGAISAMLAVVIGVPALLAAVQQLRLARRAEIAQLFARLGSYVQEWDSPDLLAVRKKALRLTSEELRQRIAAAYARTSDEPFDEAVEFLRIPNYFEHLGWIAQEGGDPVEAIDAALGSIIRVEWSRWEPVAATLRQATGDPAIYRQFETLAARLAERRQKLNR